MRNTISLQAPEYRDTPTTQSLRYQRTLKLAGNSDVMMGLGDFEKLGGEWARNPAPCL